MNRIFKLSVLWLIVVAVMFSSSVFCVFAEDAEAEEPLTEAEIKAATVENIVDRLTAFSRYSTVTQKSLYKAAMEKIMEENPELYEKVLKAMLESIDENSAYYNAQEAVELFQELNEEVTGIGVNVITNDEGIIVSQPIPGSPAELAGIKAGDIIIGADNIDLRGMDFENALNKIRGPEGTMVKITVIRSGISEPLTFNIVRAKVTQNPIAYEVIERDGKKVAKITIYSFTETGAMHFKEALAKADSEKISNILIDLRDNGGGYLDQAVDIAGCFLPKDAVITTEEHKMSMLNKVYTAAGTDKKYKVVILVNGMSASASEVLTAALVENDVAFTVGTKTFGKGTVQNIAHIADGGVLKFTAAYYLTPDGNNIHKKGIMPTVPIENSYSPVDMSQFDTFALNKVYKLGDSGKEVKLAKEMLKLLGIFVGEVNETYDENLKIAVTTYQKMDKLFPYGVLDITTQMNLYDTVKTSEVENDDQLDMALDMF